MDRVAQPFDPAKFNFTKAHPDESLFQLRTASEPSSPAPRFSLDAAPAPLGDPTTTDVVMVNISPIGPTHVLYLPSFQSLLPQQMDTGGLRRALEFVHLIDAPAFRLGFNSFGAYASVNHLHFQGYELPGPVAIEVAETREIASSAAHALRILRTTDYPVRCLEVRIQSIREAAEAARIVTALCQGMEASNQPYNLYIVDRGLRTFVIPQRFEAAKIAGEVPADLIETCMNPATFEIAGHMLMKREEDFVQGFDEARTEALLACCSLGEDAFEEWARCVRTLVDA